MSVTTTLIGVISFPSTTLAPSAHTCAPLLFSSFSVGGVSGSLSSFKSPIVGFVVSVPGVVSVTVTGIFTSTSSPFGRVTVTTAVLSPAVDTSGCVLIATVDPCGRFLILSLYWSSVG